MMMTNRDSRVVLGLALMVLVLLACGGKGNAPTAADAGDAGGDASRPTDAATDAAADGAADADGNSHPGTVRLTVRRDGLPANGVPVVFYDAAGAILLSTTTDEGGVASSSVPVDGKVVAVTETPAGPTGYLWDKVEGGDDLVLNIASGDLYTTNVTLPVHNGGSGYFVDTPCGSGWSASPTVAVEMRKGCTYGHVVGSWIDDGDQGPSFFVDNQTFASGGTLDLSAKSYQNLSDVTVGATNVADEVGTVKLTGHLVRAGWKSAFSFGTEAAPVNHALMVEGQADDIPSADLLTSVSVEGGRRVVLKRGPVNDGEVDFGAALLPAVSSPTWSAETRTLSWTQDGAAPAGTATVASIVLGVVRDEGLEYLTWYVVTPASSSVVFPELPEALADMEPQGSLFIGLGGLVNSSAGLDEIRQRGLSISDPELYLRAPGQVSLSSWVLNP